MGEEETVAAEERANAEEERANAEEEEEEKAEQGRSPCPRNYFPLLGKEEQDRRVPAVDASVRQEDGHEEDEEEE